MNLKARLKVLLITPRVVASALLAFLILLSLNSPLEAQTVLQGYGSDETLQKGMLVTTKKSDPAKVEAVTDKTVTDLKGVVADSNDSPVTLSDGEKKIFVATQGTYEVLVSNENGSIRPGDLISVSSLAGIAMKASETQSIVLGRAVGEFAGSSDSIGKTTAKDGRTVAFGRIQVDIGIGKNPIQKNPETSKVPEALQKLADSVAEKPVSAIRIYLGLAVILVTSIVAGTTLFSGVRSAIISLGRNPLSKSVILRGMIQVVLISLIVFITGLFGVYLLIKL